MRQVVSIWTKPCCLKIVGMVISMQTSSKWIRFLMRDWNGTRYMAEYTSRPWFNGSSTATQPGLMKLISIVELCCRSLIAIRWAGIVLNWCNQTKKKPETSDDQRTWVDGYMQGRFMEGDGSNGCKGVVHEDGMKFAWIECGDRRPNGAITTNRH